LVAESRLLGGGEGLFGNHYHLMAANFMP